MAGSVDFFMWLHAWNCCDMHTRNRKEEIQAFQAQGRNGDKARNSAAGNAAGLNTCAQPKGTVGIRTWNGIIMNICWVSLLSPVQE